MKLIALFATLFVAVAAQDKQEPPMPKPGKEHELLKQFVGKWEVIGKFFMNPDQPPMDIQGSETVKMDLGDFWLLGHFKGEFLGKPFEGRSVMGYSPAKKKYVGSWVDDMMPHLFVNEGDVDEAGKVFTMVGEGFDPATGKPAKEKWVMEIKGADSHTMTFYTTGADGKERKTGELSYKRKEKKN